MDITQSSCLVASARLRRILIHQARMLKHVCPFTASASMAMLEVLTKVVGAVELLGRVAFPKFVHLLQVADTFVPVLVGSALGKDTTTEGTSTRGNAGTGKFVTTVAAEISLTGTVSRLMEGSVIT